MGMFLIDLRIAARTLLRKPGFTAAVALTLALGIGAGTAVFSVVNAILFRPLPFHKPERLVVLWSENLQREEAQERVSLPDFRDWKARQRVFERLAAVSEGAPVLTLREGPERLSGANVSADLFPLLGVSPLLGRAFTPEEDRPGMDQVVVLSHGLWMRCFGGDPNVVGRRVTLDGDTRTILGVMPAGFNFPEKTDVWLPLGLSPEQEARGGRYLLTIGRLKPAVTLQQAQSAMSGIARQLEVEYPDSNDGYGVILISLQQYVVGETRRPLLVLLSAVGFVALVVCANVAAMLLARGASRSGEIGIRMALGAPRGKLVRQLMTESVLLALLGGVIGLLFAVWGSRLLVATSPIQLPRLNEVEIDSTVIAFNFLLALTTGVLFGLTPAVHASQPHSSTVLRNASRASSPGLAAIRLQSIILVAQIAVTLVLLVSAWLMIESFRRLMDVNPGFQPSGLLTFRIKLPSSRYSEPRQKSDFFHHLLERLLEAPGVTATAAVTNLPLSGTNMLFPVTAEDGEAAANGRPLFANYRAATSGYLSTMGVSVLEGRELSPSDDDRSAPVVVVNQALAKRLWPSGDPIGKRLLVTYGNGAPHEVVGVVDDLRHFGLAEEAQPELYVSDLQNPWSFMTFVVRTTGDPKALIAYLRVAVAALDPNQPIDEIRSMEDILSDSTAHPRFLSVFLGIFAGLALLTAGLGIFGLTTYWVNLRKAEIGIRSALGAKRGTLVALFVRNLVTLAIGGVAIGTALALAVTRVLSGLLYGVSPTDPLTFAAMTVLLITAATLAAWIPAHQGSRVDPVIALRHE